MEIKTCEQYVIAKLEETENTVDELEQIIEDRTEKLYAVVSERDLYKVKYEDLKEIIKKYAENSGSMISFFVHDYCNNEEFDFCTIAEILEEKNLEEVKEKLNEIEEETKENN